MFSLGYHKYLASYKMLYKLFLNDFLTNFYYAKYNLLCVFFFFILKYLLLDSNYSRYIILVFFAILAYSFYFENFLLFSNSHLIFLVNIWKKKWRKQLIIIPYFLLLLKYRYNKIIFPSNYLKLSISFLLLNIFKYNYFYLVCREYLK